MPSMIFTIHQNHKLYLSYILKSDDKSLQRFLVTYILLTPDFVNFTELSDTDSAQKVKMTLLSMSKSVRCCCKVYVGHLWTGGEGFCLLIDITSSDSPPTSPPWCPTPVPAQSTVASVVFLKIPILSFVGKKSCQKIST